MVLIQKRKEGENKGEKVDALPLPVKAPIMSYEEAKGLMDEISLESADLLSTIKNLGTNGLPSPAYLYYYGVGLSMETALLYPKPKVMRNVNGKPLYYIGVGKGNKGGVTWYYYRPDLKMWVKAAKPLMFKGFKGKEGIPEEWFCDPERWDKEYYHHLINAQISETAKILPQWLEELDIDTYVEGLTKLSEDVKWWKEKTKEEGIVAPSAREVDELKKRIQEKRKKWGKNAKLYFATVSYALRDGEERVFFHLMPILYNSSSGEIYFPFFDKTAKKEELNKLAEDLGEKIDSGLMIRVTTPFGESDVYYALPKGPLDEFAEMSAELLGIKDIIEFIRNPSKETSIPFVITLTEYALLFLAGTGALGKVRRGRKFLEVMGLVKEGKIWDRMMRAFLFGQIVIDPLKKLKNAKTKTDVVKVLGEVTVSFLLWYGIFEWTAPSVINRLRQYSPMMGKLGTFAKWSVVMGLSFAVDKWFSSKEEVERLEEQIKALYYFISTGKPDRDSKITFTNEEREAFKALLLVYESCYLYILTNRPELFTSEERKEKLGMIREINEQLGINYPLLAYAKRIESRTGNGE